MDELMGLLITHETKLNVKETRKKGKGKGVALKVESNESPSNFEDEKDEVLLARKFNKFMMRKRNESKSYFRRQKGKRNSNDTNARNWDTLGLNAHN